MNISNSRTGTRVWGRAASTKQQQANISFWIFFLLLLAATILLS
jgi:hypothetical protein